MSNHDDWLRPTPAMLAAMADAVSPARLNGWDHGSRTVSALKTLGWVRAVKVNGSTRYEATDIGRAALEGK